MLLYPVHHACMEICAQIPGIQEFVIMAPEDLLILFCPLFVVFWPTFHTLLVSLSVAICHHSPPSNSEFDLHLQTEAVSALASFFLNPPSVVYCAFLWAHTSLACLGVASLSFIFNWKHMVLCCHLPDWAFLPLQNAKGLAMCKYQFSHPELANPWPS